MRLLGIHPGPLLYTKVFLRLEPLGLELVAAAARCAGHTVRLIDLQVEDHRAYFRLLHVWRPDVVAFSCNYLANVPEIVDLAKATKARFPRTFVCVRGHSASFTATALIEHGKGAICVLKGEGEAGMPLMLAAIETGTDVTAVPGAVTAVSKGPPPSFVHWLVSPERAPKICAQSASPASSLSTTTARPGLSAGICASNRGGVQRLGHPVLDEPSARPVQINEPRRPSAERDRQDRGREPETRAPHHDSHKTEPRPGTISARLVRFLAGRQRDFGHAPAIECDPRILSDRICVGGASN